MINMNIYIYIYIAQYHNILFVINSSHESYNTYNPSSPVNNKNWKCHVNREIGDIILAIDYK